MPGRKQNKTKAKWKTNKQNATTEEYKNPSYFPPHKLQVILLKFMSVSDMTWEGLHGIRNLSDLISL